MFGCRSTARYLRLLTLLAPASRAGTLETECSSVIVKDLPIGHRTELSGPSNQVYTIRNNSDVKVDVSFSSTRPFGTRGRQHDVADAPDAAWLVVDPKTLALQPHSKGVAKLSLAIPNDKRYANKKYELWLVAKAKGTQLGVGLITRIKFNTVSHAAERADSPATTPPKDERKE
jgi:hypothetical protein